MSWTSTLLCIVVIVCSVARTHAAAISKHVIIISIDGFRNDYVDKYAAQTPNIRKLINAGLHAKTMQPIFPSSTFPNHYCIATGLYAESHGIVANNMFDPASGRYFSMSSPEVTQSMWWLGEPIWVTSELHNRTAAVAFWPGSEAEIKGKRASYWLKYDSRQPDSYSINMLLSWLDLPADKRPVLLMGYMSKVDSAGHSYGPNSQQVADAVKTADDIVGTLIHGLEQRGLWGDVDVILVSDHGMTELSLDRSIYLDDFLEPDLYEIVDSSPVTAIRPNAGQEQFVYESLHNKHPNYTVWRKQDIPLRFHYTHNDRIMPLIGLADIGWYVGSARNKGAHGFDNTEPDMGALFVATGPGFKHGQLPSLNNIDVYSLLCYRLHIAPAPNNGTLHTLEPFLN